MFENLITQTQDASKQIRKSLTSCGIARSQYTLASPLYGETLGSKKGHEVLTVLLVLISSHAAESRDRTHRQVPVSASIVQQRVATATCILCTS